MVGITSPVLPTEAEAAAWKAQYEVNWHPAGYGTRLTVRPVEGGWQVTGYRASSCD